MSDEFFFPSVGMKHWSSSHQALLASHQMGRFKPQPPAPLWSMPDFSMQNDLSMPIIDWVPRCDPPGRVEWEPLSDEERKRVWRNILIVGGLLCFVPPLAPIGFSVVLLCAAAGALRRLNKFLESGLIEERLGRFFRFAWSGVCGLARWMVRSLEARAASRRRDRFSKVPSHTSF